MEFYCYVIFNCNTVNITRCNAKSILLSFRENSEEIIVYPLGLSQFFLSLAPQTCVGSRRSGLGDRIGIQSYCRRLNVIKSNKQLGGLTLITCGI